MDVIEAIKTRKSIRGFKPDPVPKEVLREILEIASRAPSSMNTQPWEFTVVAGEVLDQIKQANIEKLTSGEKQPSEIKWEEYTGVYRQRQVALAIQLFQSMNITREDKQGRAEWMQRGFRFFDAPAAIIISMDRSVGDMGLFDIGAVSQTIALVALKYGLGTCIQSQGTSYPGAIRKHTSIPESSLIVICLCIGYPDDDFPANRVQSERESLENNTKWYGI